MKQFQRYIYGQGTLLRRNCTSLLTATAITQRRVDSHYYKPFDRVLIGVSLEHVSPDEIGPCVNKLHVLLSLSQPY